MVLGWGMERDFAVSQIILFADWQSLILSTLPSLSFFRSSYMFLPRSFAKSAFVITYTQASGREIGEAAGPTRTHFDVKTLQKEMQEYAKLRKDGTLRSRGARDCAFMNFMMF